jgi:hypothetical protein
MKLMSLSAFALLISVPALAADMTGHWVPDPNLPSQVSCDNGYVGRCAVLEEFIVDQSADKLEIKGFEAKCGTNNLIRFEHESIEATIDPNGVDLKDWYGDVIGTLIPQGVQFATSSLREDFFFTGSDRMTVTLHAERLHIPCHLSGNFERVFP